MTPGIRLFIDGRKVADGSPDDDPTAPYAIDGLTVSWGRPTTVDQPDPTSCSFTLHSRTDYPDPDLFGSTVRLGRAVLVDAGRADAPVFLGQITDVSMTTADDDPAGLLVLAVVCDDVLADLNNRAAASVPWPVESVALRVGHVLEAARVHTPYTVSTDLASILVKRIDADQGQTSMAAELLADIATSVDGVLWSVAAYVAPDVTAPTPAVWLESPAGRAPLRRLAYVAPYVVIVDVSAAAGALILDPCLIPLEPIEFRQTMSDLVTGVSVTYYTPDPADPASDVGTVASVIDPAAESPARPWGARRMTLDSQLTSSADATTTASKILARMSTPSWRLNNITVDQGDPPSVSDADMLRLIGLRTRHGLPVIIAPLPPWSPPDSDTFTGYLEGGEITSTAGVWSTTLWLSLAQGYAGVAARWSDLPDSTDWQWQDFDPAIRWADLTGVGGPS